MVEDVVSALKRYRYVDDEEFARRYAERRATAGKSGARLLRLELRAKGVTDKETIESAVADAFERAPEADAVEALIEKRLKGRPISGPDDLRRLRDFLLRRGFDPETVYDRLRGISRGRAGDDSHDDDA